MEVTLHPLEKVTNKTPEKKCHSGESTICLDVAQEVGKWFVNGIFYLLINGIYRGYKPCTNHLLTTS